MKKLFIIFVLLCFALGTTACVSNKIESENHSFAIPPVLSSDTAENMGANEESVLKDMSPEVPYVLVFDSFEDIVELKEMIEQNDDDIQNYLDSHGFKMNGLSTREDIVNFFNQIGDLNMLHLSENSGYDLVGISYYISYGYVMSTYCNDNDIVRFICYYDNDIENGSIATEVVDATDKLTILNEDVALYNVADENSPFALSGMFYTENSHITILLSSQNGNESINESMGTNVVEATLMELLEQ